jgi:hypothetical protein
MTLRDIQAQSVLAQWIRRLFLSRGALALLVGCVVIIDGCARRDVHHLIRQNFASPDRSPKILAVYMPWFGDSSHIDVGYSTQDPEVVSRQIAEARKMGISAFIADWYGNRSPFLDKSFAVLQQVARQKHFQVALMYDETEAAGDEATEEAIEAFDKAYKTYIGPIAANRDAYLTFKGRPLIFVFPKQGHTDWDKVRAETRQWVSPPLLIYKDGPPAAFADAFDGYYAWVHPGNKGWSADGSDWGEQYLENFYSRMKQKYPDKIAVGAAWPGFDDSRAQWGLHRYMNAQCGKTFEDTLRLFRNYFNDSQSLPFLMVETWNDYEEGTAIEHPVFRSCSAPTERPTEPYAKR